jgi:hypothetical protein
MLLGHVCLVYGEQEDQQQTIQLTRESVEKLLQVLTPACKIEMEAALGSQVEISDECKIEIQRIVATFQTTGSDSDGENGRSRMRQTGQGEKKQKPGKASSAPPTKNKNVSPIFSIAAFVVSFVVVVAGLVMYINSKRAAQVVLKPKKLSKKKVRNCPLKCITIFFFFFFFSFLLFILTLNSFLGVRRKRCVRK